MSYSLNVQYQKSLLNAYSNATQTVNANGKVTFDSVNVSNGCSIDFDAGTSTATLQKPGVYMVTVDASVSDNGTQGTIGLQINRNGTGINGATSKTTTTASANLYPLSVTTLVKVLPSCCAIDNTTTVSVSNIGLGAIYSNVNLTIIKLC